ncbi:Rpn family recombination-promoting nuclease/putative transposase [Pantoea osteomyelitidis]|uniref:Rpn family recombination-promoting nuclease/putative transposase n=1 Tax=Pantoea osteomyelitidis TaxID=3230026 RepID=A0ABW7PSR3_9GAMM
METHFSPVPHDGLFKTFLTHTATAQDFLTFHLPPGLLKVCNLDTLRLESCSFIEEDLRPYFADVLYSLKTARGDSYVYTLIEHQSSPDKHMAFRLMRYAIAAMQRHLDAGHTQLPLVIPLLFCHGRASPWPCTLNWLDLFSEPDLARQLYSNAFPLIDVGAMSDDVIMQHRAMAILELMFKHVHRRDLAELTDPLVKLMSAEYNTSEQRDALMHWVMQNGDSARPELFLQTLARRLPQHREVFMTIAERLEQKARLEGKQSARMEIAQALLRKGVEPVVVMETTGLTKEELAKIQH